MLVDSEGDNVLTPIPSWPVDANDNMSPVSVEPPNDLVQYGALKFSLWRSIGEEFMIKSTVTGLLAFLAQVA